MGVSTQLPTLAGSRMGAQGCCVPWQPCATSSECHRIGETCSPDVNEGGTFCMPPVSDAALNDTGSDVVSDTPSDGSVDATIRDAGPADAQGGDASADAGGQ
jgi:hypothetical protein